MNPIKSLARLLGIGRSATIPAALSALANRPVMMSRLALDSLLSSFSAGGIPKPEAWREDGDWSPHGSRPEHLITIVGTVGIISVSGPLFHRYGSDAYWWGGQGYDVIKAAHRQLVANNQVSHIVHDLNSPGGQCSGCFDAVDDIRSTRGIKPITAVINDCATSACYAIASAADRIVISRTGTAGSIGVIATHLDMSGYLKNAGLSYEFIVSGEKKADFNSTSPMSVRERQELQTEVDRLAGIFVETVAPNRGMEAAAIWDMQAGCFFGQGAIDAGLADEIGTLDSVIAALANPNPEDVPVPTPPSDPDDPTAEAKELAKSANMAVKFAEFDRAKAINAVMTSSLGGDLRAALLAPGVADFLTTATVGDRIAHAQTAADLCAAAGDRSLASTYITHYTTVEVMRKELLDLKATDGPELDTHPPLPKAATESSERKQRLSTDNVYGNLNNQSKSK